MMETLDKTHLLLAAFGMLVVVVFALWAVRSRIKEGIRKRRRRPTQVNEPVFSGAAEDMPRDSLEEAHDFGNLRITRDHYLAEKALVDVEVIPIGSRGRELMEEPPTETLLPLPDPAFTPAPAPITSEPPPEVSPPAPESATLNIVLTVVAPRGQTFIGSAIRDAATMFNLTLNPAGLLDFRFQPEQEPLFSMAHLRNPGTFAADTWEELRTPGLLLFMSLPAEIEAMRALEQLIVTADQFAQHLGGMICDERRQRLSNKGLAALRGQITAFQQLHDSKPV